MYALFSWRVEENGSLGDRLSYYARMRTYGYLAVKNPFN
jgi:hypothetical protein